MNLIHNTYEKASCSAVCLKRKKSPSDSQISQQRQLCPTSQWDTLPQKTKQTAPEECHLKGPPAFPCKLHACTLVRAHARAHTHNLKILLQSFQSREKPKESLWKMVTKWGKKHTLVVPYPIMLHHLPAATENSRTTRLATWGTEVRIQSYINIWKSGGVKY